MFFVPPVERIEPPSVASGTRIDEVTRSLDHFQGREKKKKKKKLPDVLCSLPADRDESAVEDRTGRIVCLWSDKVSSLKRGGWGGRTRPGEVTSPSQGTHTITGWTAGGNQISEESSAPVYEHTVNLCVTVCVIYLQRFPVSHLITDVDFY